MHPVWILLCRPHWRRLSPWFHYELHYTYPKVPSPSFPRNSNSRMFEHPPNLAPPFFCLSRDVATISFHSWPVAQINETQDLLWLYVCVCLKRALSIFLMAWKGWLVYLDSFSCQIRSTGNSEWSSWPMNESQAILAVKYTFVGSPWCNVMARALNITKREGKKGRVMRCG